MGEVGWGGEIWGEGVPGRVVKLLLAALRQVPLSFQAGAEDFVSYIVDCVLKDYEVGVVGHLGGNVRLHEAARKLSVLGSHH
jgi:hypothetical protein